MNVRLWKNLFINGAIGFSLRRVAVHWAFSKALNALRSKKRVSYYSLNGFASCLCYSIDCLIMAGFQFWTLESSRQSLVYFRCFAHKIIWLIMRVHFSSHFDKAPAGVGANPNAFDRKGIFLQMACRRLLRRLFDVDYHFHPSWYSADLKQHWKNT